MTEPLAQPARSSAQPTWRPIALVGLIAAMVLVVDQISKTLVVATLGPSAGGRTLELIPGVLWLLYVENTGAAFGLFQGRNPVLATVALVIVLLLAIWFRALAAATPWGALALGLFLTYVLIVQVIEFARPLPPSPQAAATAVPSPGGRPVAEASPPPVPAATPSPTPAAPSGVTLTVSVHEASWLRVTADGERVFQGILEAGDARTWRAEREVRVRIGNAGGVDLTVNGEPLGRLGARGEVVTRTFRATPPMP
uniref:DUF4115 domain-containing protein n=1 Tax=Thermorudis peleae TaxID=1382356 RepID=A0A831TF20_9BACT